MHFFPTIFLIVKFVFIELEQLYLCSRSSSETLFFRVQVRQNNRSFWTIQPGC